MARLRRTSHLRALRVHAARMPVEALARHLAAAGDPLGLAALARDEWERLALLVRPAQLFERACEAVARDLYAAPRTTRWSPWLAARVAAEAAGLRAEDPRLWRPVASEPTPFEQTVAACFGVADDRASDLITAFHALPVEERAAVHALLPRGLFGLPPGPPPGAADARRARTRAALGTGVLRQLLAALRRPDR